MLLLTHTERHRRKLPHNLTICRRCVVVHDIAAQSNVLRLQEKYRGRRLGNPPEQNKILSNQSKVKNDEVTIDRIKMEVPQHSHSA